MSQKTRKKQPADPWTLCEAVHWIATDDPTPQPYHRWDDDKFDQAAKTLYRGLRGAVLRAYGRIHQSSQIVYPEDERLQIPAEHWNPQEALWFSNQLKAPEFEYSDIVLSKNDLIQTSDILDAKWPQMHLVEATRGKAGRPREYDHEEFWRLVCWHLQEWGIPKTQEEFVNQMGPILDIAWENLDQKPASTWLRDRARELFMDRRIYRHIIKAQSSQD